MTVTYQIHIIRIVKHVLGQIVITKSPIVTCPEPCAGPDPVSDPRTMSSNAWIGGHHPGKEPTRKYSPETWYKRNKKWKTTCPDQMGSISAQKHAKVSKKRSKANETRSKLLKTAKRQNTMQLLIPKTFTSIYPAEGGIKTNPNKPNLVSSNDPWSQYPANKQDEAHPAQSRYPHKP